VREIIFLIAANSKLQKMEAIELGLDLKFGEEGLKLMSEIQEIEDIEMLKSIA